jgi:uncharacterized membrane protein
MGAHLASAQEQAGAGSAETVEGVVTRVLKDRDVVGPDGLSQPYQLLEINLQSGPSAGELVVVEHGQVSRMNVPRYSVGDRLVLYGQETTEGDTTYHVVDAVRRNVMLALALVFVVLTIAVGRWRGLASLAGLLVSFTVVFLFILPLIVAGNDPVIVTVLGAAAIIPATFYLSHGFNRKTTAAVMGTLIALAVTGVVAQLSVHAAKLTGYSSEEAAYLQSAFETRFDMLGILTASVIIGLLGVLDDITVGQAAIVNQLRLASPGITYREVVARAMDVGTDHIASLVNTLVLVYASSALPLLLLFTVSTASIAEVVNYEMVAEEIVRMLVASIGLILAVPITTVIAGAYVTGQEGPPAAATHHELLADD